MRKYVEKDNIYSEFFVGKTEEIRAIQKYCQKQKHKNNTSVFRISEIFRKQTGLCNSCRHDWADDTSHKR